MNVSLKENLRKFFFCDVSVILLFSFILHVVSVFYFRFYDNDLFVWYSLISACLHLIHIFFYRKIPHYISFVILVAQIDFYAIFFTFFTKHPAGTDLFTLGLLAATFLLAYDMEKPRHFYIYTVIPTVAANVFMAYYYFHDMAETLPFPFSFYRIHNVVACVSITVLLIYLCSSVERKLILTAKKAAARQEALQYAANHDSLTTLINRRRIWEHLAQAHQNKQKYGYEYSICICDIDDFKGINDTYGHSCGDEALHATALLMHDSIPSNVKVGRWGGEEFLFLFPSNSEQVVKDIESLRILIAENVLSYKDRKFSISMTFGISSSKNFRNTDDVLVDADNCLNRGKQNGKNCVVVSENF